MENIILIESSVTKEMVNTALNTWSPVLSKISEDYNLLSDKSKKFLCRFCHEYSLIESSELQSDTGTMNILSPTGQPTKIESKLPIFIKILSDAVIRLDGFVNFHISSGPNFHYIETKDGKLMSGNTSTLTVNQSNPICREFIATNFHEVYESMFIHKSIEHIIEEFKKYDDVVVYPAWFINEVSTAEGTEAPQHVVRLVGRFMGIEPEVEVEEKVEDEKEAYKKKAVGYWEVGGKDAIEVYLLEKPKAFHKLMIRLFFGVKWIDIKKETTGPVNG